MLKIVVVATIALSAIAQPYYQTATPQVFNVKTCTADSGCGTATDEGASVYCYKVTYKQGVTTTTPATGTAVAALNLCFPSGFAEMYTTVDGPLKVSQTASTTASTDKFDTWQFTRVATVTTAAAMQTKCTTNDQCASLNSATDTTLPKYCCADVVTTQSYITVAGAQASTKFCIADYSTAPSTVKAPTPMVSSTW